MDHVGDNMCVPCPTFVRLEVCMLSCVPPRRGVFVPPDSGGHRLHGYFHRALRAPKHRAPSQRKTSPASIEGRAIFPPVIGVLLA